ncbi:glutamate--tRNA ligase [Marinivivus vitaminiproducens]|uniref:glutamate--tRNA ligase n=1 Tax=Marinivivus vitaminiproducens TaxID=3035935 RepID=UPI0027A74A66|nr:glutamate--tRNA ligase [Geminicoccaceae bacterium SCSIO 64248]
MSVITRFAPSPTGYLHIGGARTALFNWLYARHHGGRYLLRIEDTDRARSTEAAIAAIHDGLSWLGLEGDEPAVLQTSRQARHVEVAQALLAAGGAYHCYATQAELEAMRAEQRAAGQQVRYDGRWRDRDPASAPAGVPPVVRLRAPQEGDTVIDDLVQGEVRVANGQLDDLILLRADGTPTYMFGVVVDDHDMSVTHVIRGDDHLTNAFRQYQIYKALGWQPPRFGHVPMILGADGAKLSKRHGALGVDAYRDMGLLPEAMRNYLLRLGWGHGDAEILSTDEAIALFDTDGIGCSPSRFDMTKLLNLNGHYIREAPNERLVEEVVIRLESDGTPIGAAGRDRLLAGMDGLKQRAKTLIDLADAARFYVATVPLVIEPKAEALLDEAGRARLAAWRDAVGDVEWKAQPLEAATRAFAEESGIKLGAIAQPLRAALTGSLTSPPVFEVLEVLGREESLARLGLP